MKKVVSLLAGAAMMASSSAMAAEYIMKLATNLPTDPMATPTGAGFRVFELKAEEYTYGNVDVQVFHEGQLGNQMSNLQQTIAGDIQGAESPIGMLANVFPPMGFGDLPYVFPDSKVASDLFRLDNPFISKLNAQLRETVGIGVLAFFPQGFRNTTNNVREIKSVEDLKGLKIRTMQVKPHIAMINATGAGATPIPWLELYTSLQTGVVDGQENPFASMKAINLQEVQKYLTKDKHVLLVGTLIYNVEWMNGLPKDIQQALFKAASEARIASTVMGTLLDDKIEQEFIDSGVKIYSPNKEEMEGFRSVMGKAGREWFEEANGEDGKKLLDELRQEIENIQKSYADYK